ncbi:MAG: type II toxin-antitoxin system VapC family toxin [Melioribacteraceae bacterium]|nr:type II toxin-antitoxin system VapC family toxin [Melioribacteraceae bacterium]
MITLDTHIIIWNAIKPEHLSKKAKNAIDTANKTDGIIISDISLWEIAMLISKNRLEIEIPYLDFIGLIKAANNFQIKEITPEIAELSTKYLSEINLDLADRIISATSILSNAPLVTADSNLRKSKKIKTIW